MRALVSNSPVWWPLRGWKAMRAVLSFRADVSSTLAIQWAVTARKGCRIWLDHISHVNEIKPKASWTGLLSSERSLGKRLTSRSFLKTVKRLLQDSSMRSCNFVWWGIMLSWRSLRKSSRRAQNSGHSTTLMDWSNKAVRKRNIRGAKLTYLIVHDNEFCKPFMEFLHIKFLTHPTKWHYVECCVGGSLRVQILPPMHTLALACQTSMYCALICWRRLLVPVLITYSTILPPPSAFLNSL